MTQVARVSAPQHRSALPTIAAIKRSVAHEFSVSVPMLSEPAPSGHRRLNTHDIAHPRQVAMALAMLLTDHSRCRVGFFFGGRHPATVRHACAQVERRRRADARLHAAMRRMTFDLLGRD